MRKAFRGYKIKDVENEIAKIKETSKADKEVYDKKLAALAAEKERVSREIEQYKLTSKSLENRRRELDDRISNALLERKDDSIDELRKLNEQKQKKTEVLEYLKLKKKELLDDINRYKEKMDALAGEKMGDD